MQRIAPLGVTPQPDSGASPEEICAHLERILASPAFRASKRCHRFLEFVIRQRLAGNSAGIKERTLAIEVFDRSAAWDAGGDDTIVRVGAREVRKRLAQYYSSPEGLQEHLRIELPLGSYVPEIVRVDYPAPLSEPVPAEPVAVNAAPLPAPAEDALKPASSRKWLFVATPLAVVGLLSAVYFLLPPPSLSDQFWAPFVNSRQNLLIGVASPIVYTPSARAYSLNDRQFGAPALPVVRPLQLQPSQLNGADFVPLSDEYLAFGDAIAATSLQLLLAKHSREANIHFASRVEFGEFRDSPVILIGAFTNRWTLELTQHYRYHFGFDAHWIPAILDSQSKQIWSIPQKQDNGNSPEDYFLVCRLPASPAGTPMLIIAGVEQFGTEAAGRFVSDASRLNSVLRTFGKDWQNKKLEFVMHARVIDHSPAAPDLVASYSW